MRVLLSLDYSTTATGWAKFDLDSGKLLAFGVIKPDLKTKASYPEAQVLKLRRLAVQLLELIDANVEIIVIEEINRGKSRLGQKTLDGGHYIFLEKMPPNLLKKVRYVDSDGADGWRSANGLGLQLSPIDKQQNKSAKAYNKKFGKKNKAKGLVTQKTLACRYVNKKFGLKLDASVDSSEGDIADAIGLGYHVLVKELYSNVG